MVSWANARPSIYPFKACGPSWSQAEQRVSLRERVEENFDQNWRFRLEQRHGASVVFEVVCGHFSLSKSASYSRRSSYKQDWRLVRGSIGFFFLFTKKQTNSFNVFKLGQRDASFTNCSLWNNPSKAATLSCLPKKYSFFKKIVDNDCQFDLIKNYSPELIQLVKYCLVPANQRLNIE